MSISRETPNSPHALTPNHAKTSAIKSWFKFQTTLPYKLLQTVFNNCVLITASTLPKKHRTLLICPHIVLRFFRMSSLSSQISLIKLPRCSHCRTNSIALLPILISIFMRCCYEMTLLSNGIHVMRLNCFLTVSML